MKIECGKKSLKKVFVTFLPFNSILFVMVHKFDEISEYEYQK